MRSRIAVTCVLLCSLASAAAAATVSGLVSDPTGASVSGARVVFRGLATGQESSLETAADGRFTFDTPAAGTYLVIVTHAGFSEAARTVVVTAASERIDVPVQLEIRGLTAEVSVTAARAE